ncbi:aldo/keto reductase [Falsirhodobacter deserti]|uniref:aldo/keto reductase n=1 Tax=Falsirhodobacter deserti TaxID=1365611 RepID=UPI000FE34ECB|nr:aldo/keto reductase [Falsirhodobacter deserti]
MHDVTANGASIPALGFGTFRMDEGEVAAVLPEALRLGFRHVDTAQIYGNEAAVGQAIKDSGVARNEVFLTTKVWVDKFAADAFLPSVEESLKKLGTDHVDLLLLHWPGGSDTPREVQIEQLNKARDAGMTRHIGISNYSSAQMREAARLSAAPIATNQVEYHPWLSQKAVLDAARELGMSLTAYYAMADGKSATDPTLAEIGARHGKTAAQVALRWQVQQPGVITLSKTAKVERLAENLAIFDFELTEEEMQAIHGMARPDGRIVSPQNLAPAWD